MRYLNFEVSFEKKVTAFGNAYRNVTSTENVYWFGTPDTITILPEVVMNVVKGHYSMLKKFIAENNSQEAQFHIFATDTKTDHTQSVNSFRFSIYVRWGKVDRVYIKLYNQPQIEYSEYINKENPENMEFSIPKIKSLINTFLKDWFSDERNIFIQ